MSGRRSAPPWDYLQEASIPSLESFELSRLNHAANMRREMAALLDQWIEDNAQALLARWLRDRPALCPEQAAHFNLQAELPFAEPCAPVAIEQSIERSSARPTATVKLSRRRASSE